MLQVKFLIVVIFLWLQQFFSNFKYFAQWRHFTSFKAIPQDVQNQISNCWLVLCLCMPWPSLVVTELFFTYLWFPSYISFFTTVFADQPLASSSLVLSAHQPSNCYYFLNHSSVSHKPMVLQYLDFYVLDICIKQCMYLRVGKKAIE